MKMRVRSEVLAFRKNRVLADLTGSWVVFPGGGVDKGENPREAAKREFREEAGRDVINVDVASHPTLQTWPKDYAAKATWSKGYTGGCTYWFTGSTSEEVTDGSHKDFQAGFDWHPIKDVIERLKGELPGDWTNDVKARIDILKTHLEAGQKIAELVGPSAPLLASVPLATTISPQVTPMLKMACRILDVYDDSELEVASKLASQLGNVTVAERDAVEALEDRQFGLVLKTASGALRRRYPLHDADSTKLSAAYFREVRASLPDEVAELVHTKIAAAERYFNVGGECIAPEQVDAVMSLVNYVDSAKIAQPRQKVAHAEQHWGLSIDGKNFFPLHDATLVKVAVARFTETAGTLEPEERFAYARTIEKRASALGVEIPSDSMVNWYTADGLNLNALAEALTERKRVMKAASASTEVLDQLFEAAGCAVVRGDIESDASFAHRSEKQASLRRASIDPAKIISTLQTFDKFAGFTSFHYMRGLLDPFAACFKRDDISKKAAMIVDGVDLSTLSPEQLSAKFGPEFVQEFQQNPQQVYSSLPSPMKSIIRQFCNQGGQKEQSNVATPVGDPSQGLGATYANAGGFVGS